MYYAIQRNEVLCEAESLPALKEQLVRAVVDEDTSITVVQKLLEIRMERELKFVEVRASLA